MPPNLTEDASGQPCIEADRRPVYGLGHIGLFLELHS